MVEAFGIRISERHFVIFNILLTISLIVGMRTYLGSIYDLRAICEDGWRSGSIGTQGACSSHGGVDRSAANAAATFSIFFGLFLTYFVNKIQVLNFVSEKLPKNLVIDDATLVSCNRSLSSEQPILPETKPTVYSESQKRLYRRRYPKKKTSDANQLDLFRKKPRNPK
jgi:hypothetical protein